MLRLKSHIFRHIFAISFCWRLCEPFARCNQSSLSEDSSIELSILELLQSASNTLSVFSSCWAGLSQSLNLNASGTLLYDNFQESLHFNLSYLILSYHFFSVLLCFILFYFVLFYLISSITTCRQSAHATTSPWTSLPPLGTWGGAGP